MNALTIVALAVAAAMMAMTLTLFAERSAGSSGQLVPPQTRSYSVDHGFTLVYYKEINHVQEHSRTN